MLKNTTAHETRDERMSNYLLPIPHIFMTFIFISNIFLKNWKQMHF